MAQVLRFFFGGVDIEVVECYYWFKEDVFSGMVLKFGEIIVYEMG